MTFLHWTWCFPQTLLGALYKLTLDSVVTVPYTLGSLIVYHAGRNSVSLGRYLICANEDVVKHEFGHCRQSLILGPLYLLVIGIPSKIWDTLKCMGLFKSIDYYAFYTEKWADKLGGVIRH